MISQSLPESGGPQERFHKHYLTASVEFIFKSKVNNIAHFPIAGDASDRSYFRVSFKPMGKEDRHESIILMQLKDPLPDEESDFINILKFLKGLDSPVPNLFHYDKDRGLLFLEDCGDVTLEEIIHRHPDRTRDRYLQAVELLAQFQYRATRAVGSKCPAYHLRFDTEKLMWEFEFMLDHYVGGLQKTPLKKSEWKELRQQFFPVCKKLEKQPLCFTHRDYHSRNLMVHKDKLVMLDFQDARMGPCQYDLVSLLKDSYVQLNENMRESLVAHYIQLKQELESKPVDREEFDTVFDWMSVQRNLKAVGTFAYQSVMKKNDRYIQYIQPTLQYVRDTLNKRTDLTMLKEVLIRSIPDLGITANPATK